MAKKKATRPSVEDIMPKKKTTQATSKTKKSNKTTISPGMATITVTPKTEEIIEEVISSQRSAISEKESAEKLLEKKMRVWKNLPILEFKKKAYEFLLRRGFEYEIVKSVVEKITELR